MLILLVTDKFAPEIGGACVVPVGLALHLPQNIIVAAPKVQRPGYPIRDWQAYDQQFPFRVLRVDSFLTKLSPRIPSRLRGPLQFGWNLFVTRRRALRVLTRFLDRNPVDILCLNTLSSYWVLTRLKRRYPRVKLIFYAHGEELTGADSTLLRTDILQRKAPLTADAVISVSAFTRNLALHCKVPARKITVINNGVDTQRFVPGPRDPTLEQRFGLHGKRVLLCLARLDEHKGQDMLLRAMPAVLAAVPETILLLVGGGDDEPRLKALAASLALDARVIFAGIASDAEVLQYYQTADVYIMPNRTIASGITEGFGLVFLEAGACAKPVIGGNAGGAPDAIIHEVTGLLVDGTSVEDIASACIRLLADPDLALRMGENGLAHSRRNTWQAKAQQFLTLCQSLLPPNT